MTKNKNATKYYSNRQEEYISKLLGGKKVAGSGSPHFCAGDVITDDWLFECKCPMTERQSFSIKKEWIDKNERERMSLQKPYSALCFQFEPDGENYFVVKEKLFKEMLDKFEEE